VPDEDLVLVYDGDCPVCSSYVRYVRLKESVGRIEMVNARDGGPWVERVRNAGLDLDQGMVLIYGGRFYHGADCIHMLALLSTPSGLFNRINAAVFSSPRLSGALYPLLRAGRNLLLRLLGRRPLHLH
jgi:predicted DCC family thiol-disulfide oxidoreductase YuxK